MRRPFTIVEPAPERFNAAVLELVLRLCARAEAERLSDVFHLAAPQRVLDSVLFWAGDTLAGAGIEWLRSAQGLRTRSGLRVSAGPRALAAADYDHVVVVCSGRYPDRATLDRVQQRTLIHETATVTLVFDVKDPPRRGAERRELAARFNGSDRAGP